MSTKLKPAVCREVILEKRRLRMARRGKPEHVKDQVWVALTSLTEFREDPERRCGELTIGEQAAINVRRAHLAARKAQ